jgi:hypothetical protein
MEKIVIFGSTGMTGLCAVDAAIKKGILLQKFVYKINNQFLKI